MAAGWLETGVDKRDVTYMIVPGGNFNFYWRRCGLAQEVDLPRKSQNCMMAAKRRRYEAQAAGAGDWRVSLWADAQSPGRASPEKQSAP